MNYHHLTQEERDQLAVLRSQGKTLREIGQVLGRHHSALARELLRNLGFRNQYFPHTAQARSEERKRRAHGRERLKSPALRRQVEQLLEKRWSPQVISGHLRRHRPDLPSISREAIYQWIYSERRDLIHWLARARPRRFPRRSCLKHRLQIPGRVSIQARPVPVQGRQEPGHWETDLVVSRSGALQVLVERQTRYCRLRKVPTKTAAASRAALTLLLGSIPAGLRRSITYDNGSENKEHQVLNEDFGLSSYFCAPYHSWEKGTVENTNGLIRRFLPKQTLLAEVPDQAIAELEHWLNTRPRVVLNYQTPQEAFEALCRT